MATRGNPVALERVVYEDSRMVGLKAPYVSGFLAFREVPFLVELVQRLQEKEPDLMPQVLLVDGNGVLHQRGFGVACHLGVLTELPCVGVAKKLLQVEGLENNASHKEKIVLLQAGGDTFPLIGNSGTVLGMALKSHDHSTKPLYVSVGHRISLEVAVRLTHRCCRFRIPEPIRQADIRSREYIRRTLGHHGESPAQRKDRLSLHQAFERPLESKGTSDTPWLFMSPVLDVITRSQKEQSPNACPAGGPGAPADQGRPPECCGRSSSTDLRDPEPGFQEQKDQQLEGTRCQEGPDLWPPSPAWV
ncbi:endonuclease V isoform X3 [Rattus rattus]|uniref:endonuclease V isoform X3 n=1 Tax=Rattus rattus TaxID=10117 RepID=UPI0013F31C0B|nr:endonuclease V isoform X3 [Rattus rattus]